MRAVPTFVLAMVAVVPAACADPGARAASYMWPVIRVVDGDTLKVDAGADMPPELATLSVLVRGVDTPETGRRAKCEAERRAGRAATAFTAAAIGGATSVTIRNPAWGRYGGWVLADVDVDGRSLAAALIAAGHGRVYDGARRAGWCSAAP